MAVWLSMDKLCRLCLEGRIWLCDYLWTSSAGCVWTWKVMSRWGIGGCLILQGQKFCGDVLWLTVFGCNMSLLIYLRLSFWEQVSVLCFALCKKVQQGKSYTSANYLSSCFYKVCRKKMYMKTNLVLQYLFCVLHLVVRLQFWSSWKCWSSLHFH